MSPKSRGRPPGRGRKQRKRATSRPAPALSQEAAVLREAVALTDPTADVLAAELFASTYLGGAWQAASLGDRQAEADAARALAAEARRKPSPAGAAALAALRLMADADTAHELTRLIAELGQPVPDWAEDLAPAPTAAWLAEDPWGSSRSWFVRYDDPWPHALIAHVIHPGGTEVAELAVTAADGLEYYDEIQEDEDVPAVRAEVPVQDALAALRDALRATDLLWPRERSASYVENRLLVRRRVEAHADPETPWEERIDQSRLSDDERVALRDEFLAGRPDAGPDDATQYVTTLFLDYGEGYLGRDALSWSPTDVLLFLLDYVPRKVVLDDDDRRLLPGLLAEWVRFALRRRGVEDRWIEPVVAAVDQNTEEFHDTYDDESRFGPAKQMATWMSAQGVDITDEDAMQRAVGGWNAEQLARRALMAGGDLPPGSAVRLTVSLRGVRPRVWRRIVVPAELTLGQLHHLLQGTMGWDDSHLHLFDVDGERYGDPDFESTDLDEEDVRLSDLAEPGFSFVYEYDFGDSWQHDVTVNEVLLPADLEDDDSPVPRCEAGRNACPPEDIGGVPGYAELVSALTDPDHASEWGTELVEGYEGFDPTLFSVDGTSEWLQRVTARMGPPR